MGTFDGASETENRIMRVDPLNYGGSIMRILIPALLVILSNSCLATQIWRIELKQDSAIPWGKVQMLEGQIPPEGMRFAIVNMDLSIPVQATLTAEKPGLPLTLKLYYDTFSRPKREIQTDATGVAVARFRSGANVGLDVLGPKDARFQLLVWAGEKVPLKAQPFVSMESYVKAHPEAARKVAPTVTRDRPITQPVVAEPATVPSVVHPAESSTTKATPVAKTDVPPTPVAPVAQENPMLLTLAVALLAGILLALAAIVVLMLRGKKQPPPALWFLVLILSAAAAPHAAQAEDRVAYSPHPITAKDLWAPMNQEFQKMGDRAREFSKWIKEVNFDGIPEAGAAFDKYAKALPTVLALMEEFGLLEPRENLVVADYAPADLPALPVHDYPPGPNNSTVIDSMRLIANAHRTLEDNYVVYKQTMLTEERLKGMADAAADWSALSKTVWTFEKANPDSTINKAKQQFLDKYDGGFKTISEKLREALLEIGRCERETHDEHDWYVRYGLPFYNYLIARYKRP